MPNMAAITETKSSGSKEDLLAVLRKFIDTYESFSRLQLDPYVMQTEVTAAVREGFYLMKNLTVSRPAVLTFIGEIYHEYATDAISYQENPDYRCKFQQDSDFAILEEIKSVLLTLLDNSESVWCPIVSKWVLELLSNFSRTFAGRQNISPAGRLPQIVPSWTQFTVIQNLLSICRHCFQDSSKQKDIFVATLLETLARHTPHFDWILTCLNKSTHETMVNGVLSLGLRNFRALHRTVDDNERNEDTSLPVISTELLVTILGQLVASHSEEVRHAFDDLAQIQLNSEDAQIEIPFLLKLCSSVKASFALIDTLVGCIVGQVNHPEKFSRFLSLTCDWLRTDFPAQGAAECMTLTLVTHLMVKSTRSLDFIRILFIGSMTWHDPHRTRAFSLLYNFISEITRITFDSDSTPPNELLKLFPSISSLSQNPDFLINYLLQSNGESRVCRVALQLIKILSLFYNEGLGKRCICALFKSSTEDIHVWTLIELINSLNAKYPNILRECLTNVLVASNPPPNCLEPKTGKNQQWKVIVRILKSDNLKKTPFYFNLVTALQLEFKSLSVLLDARRMQFSIKEAALIVEIFSMIPIPVNLIATGTVLSVMHRVIDLLHIFLGDAQSYTEKKAIIDFCKRNQARLICCISSVLEKLLAKSNCRLMFRIFLIRRMVQSFLDPRYRKLFNKIVSRSAVDDEEDKNIFQFTLTTLMIENRKRVSTVTPGSIVPQTFQRGNFLKRVYGLKQSCAENLEAERNVQIFFSVLVLACSLPPHLKVDGTPAGETRGDEVILPIECNYIEDYGLSIGLDFMRQVALLFVEIVSPDVMLNGLPWPDLEYSKMLIERDLQILRTFEEYPYFWFLLELLAKYRPSLCYCSVIVRALMATFIQRWRSVQQMKATSNPGLLECSVRLLEIMKIGQFVPPPFSYLGEILPHLQSREIVGLLEDVWAYMRMHVPVRTAFAPSAATKNFVRTWDANDFDPFAMDRLRYTILKHIEALGHLLGRFFPDPDLETPASPDPG